MKKLTALFLALIMVLSLAVTAYAEDDVTATETISVSSTDTHSYEVYQIFTGKLQGDTLVDVALGKNGKLPEGTTLDDALAALEAMTGSSDTDKLSEALKYVDFTKGALGTVSKDKSMDVVPGYYLMKDIGPIGDQESYSLYLLQVVKPITINPKRGDVTSNKKVDDINDSTGVTERDQDSADYDIGDKVPFTLTGTVTERYDDFKTYYLCFHDTCAEGLTFNKGSVSVYVDGGYISTGYTVKTENLDDGCTFEVEIRDAKDIAAIKAGSVITVKYNATLNEKAVLGATGNTNKMHLEYSNDPNYQGDGDPDGETPPPTGETPEDKVIVFTYKVIVNKVDEDGDPLKGAKFTLYKKVSKVTEDDDYIETDDVDDNADPLYWLSLGTIDGADLSTFTWTGIDDGTYRLVETEPPVGYNSIDPIEFTVTATHDEENADPHLITLTAGDKIVVDMGAGTLTAEVENKPGTVLPGTGGIGTTLFYIVGGLMVCAAFVLLVTKKRMASAE